MIEFHECPVPTRGDALEKLDETGHYDVALPGIQLHPGAAVRLYRIFGFAIGIDLPQHVGKLIMAGDPHIRSGKYFSVFLQCLLDDADKGQGHDQLCPRTTTPRLL